MACKRPSFMEISLPSSRQKPDRRRQAFLKLSGQIEGQLRELYARQHEAGKVTQVTLAKKIGVSPSVINRRLLGHSNMTMETIADLIWGLNADFELKIFDAGSTLSNSLPQPQTVLPSQKPPTFSGSNLTSSIYSPVPSLSVSSS
jgi:hypothetical protein